MGQAKVQLTSRAVTSWVICQPGRHSINNIIITSTSTSNNNNNNNNNNINNSSSRSLTHS